MKIDKEMIISLLREQGNHSQADQAENELPGQVDPAQDAGLLSKLGINPQELIAKFAGGSGGSGGVGGMLGDITKKFG